MSKNYLCQLLLVMVEKQKNFGQLKYGVTVPAVLIFEPEKKRIRRKLANGSLNRWTGDEWLNICRKYFDKFNVDAPRAICSTDETWEAISDDLYRQVGGGRNEIDRIGLAYLPEPELVAMLELMGQTPRGGKCYELSTEECVDLTTFIDEMRLSPIVIESPDATGEVEGGSSVERSYDRAVEDSADPAFAVPDTRGFCSPDPASASSGPGFLSPVYDTALVDDEPSKITTTAAKISEVKEPVVRRSEVKARSGIRDRTREEAFRMFRERSLKEVDSPILRAGVGITAYSIAYMLISRLLYGADNTSMPILGWVLVVCLSVMAGGMAAIKGFDRITGCQFQLGSV